jgi:prepilin-type N-terminal cleavage/methylation domain-containing protein
MSRRRGLSLVEVLLALGIIAILVGLLLPAVTRHRSQHRGRSQCANNLKQIALAVHNYNDAYQGKLPPLVDLGEGAPSGAGLRSLFFNILPYLEQDNVYRLLNKADPTTYHRPRDGAAQAVIRVFIDPHDDTASNGSVATHAVTLADVPPVPHAQSFTGYYATTSYAANGMIPWNTGGLRRSFVDGTSNTILFAERYQLCKDANNVTTPNLWGLGVWDDRMPAFAALAPDAVAGPTLVQYAPDVPPQGAADISGSTAYVAGVIKVRQGKESSPSGVPTAPPVAGSCKPAPYRAFQVAPRGCVPCDPRVAQTPHAGGMLVGLGDGSVRSLSPSMSEWTYWAAVTPAGNETLYSDW